MAKKMKRWSVSIPYYASVLVEVEATSKKKAVQAAYDNVDPNLCHACNDTVEMGEADCTREPDVEEIK